ncbi:MAG: UxaA family hydrolase [Pseudomonadota bacterium]
MTVREVHAIRLAETDDVAVVLEATREGDRVVVAGAGEAADLVARQAIPQHHKVALVALVDGQEVRRGGVVIGTLTAGVAAGDYVHVHNLTSQRAKAAH